MTSLRFSPLRWLGASVLTLATLSPLGCEDHEPSAVVIVITSDLAPGTEIHDLNLEITRDGNTPLFKLYSVGPSQEIVTFPATITIQDDPNKETPLDVRAEVRLRATTNLPTVKGGQGTEIIRSAQVTFAKGVTKTLFLNLDPGCVGFNLSSCGVQNVTCGNYGCLSDLYEASSLPTYNESLVSNPNDCFDHTPTGCFQDSVVFPAKVLTLSKPSEQNKKEMCQVPIPVDVPLDISNNLVKNLNIAVVWASTKERYTVINREDFDAVQEGWAIKTDSGKPEIIISDGLCNAVRAGLITHIVTSTTCESKRVEQPTCKNPTIDSSWAGFRMVAPAVVDCSEPWIGLKEPCKSCIEQKDTSVVTKCSQQEGCAAILKCIAACKGEPPCLLSCSNACGEEAKIAGTAFLEAASACPNKCKLGVDFSGRAVKEPSKSWHQDLFRRGSPLACYARTGDRRIYNETVITEDDQQRPFRERLGMTKHTPSNLFRDLIKSSGEGRPYLA